MSRIHIDRAMASYKKPRIRDGAVRRFLFVVSLTLACVLLLFFLVGMNSSSSGSSVFMEETSVEFDSVSEFSFNVSNLVDSINLPKHNYLSKMLENKNQLPPRNMELYPSLAKDRIVIVLYVHNRPQYLKLVVDSLSRVSGINETLLIVSHDGYFEKMNKIVEGIRFCQVKQVFAPYSPHIFPNSFPGMSVNDCKDKDDPIEKNCEGSTDQYGNHRSPKIVSLKHHWWWMMNTVWDGLKETVGHSGDILFIEEDHFIFPNAYHNLKILTKLKPKKCPDCYASNLAPSNVKSRGEGWDSLIAERMGNVGYTFNRTVWRKIHRKAKEFCFFDDYNWDITMWVTVYPSFGGPVYSLRGPRASAVHFGKCGLHQGQGENAACVDNGMVKIDTEEIDKVANIKPDWHVHVISNQEGYQAGFRGWGGWGDKRDHQLCLDFAKMYHVRSKTY